MCDLGAKMLTCTGYKLTVPKPVDPKVNITLNEETKPEFVLNVGMLSGFDVSTDSWHGGDCCSVGFQVRVLVQQFGIAL